MPARGRPKGIREPSVRFFGALFVTTGVGTGGYMLLEGWSFTDALYMTVITLSTVGFREVQPVSFAGRIFTIGLIVAGVGTAIYVATSVGEYIISGHLRGVLRSQRMENRIKRLEDHYIVCGYGRVGQQVAEDLEERTKRCVVVDSDPELDEQLPRGRFYVIGDASDDATLRRAGIERAGGLVAATGDDAQNVFITLTARVLQSDLVIVTRVTKPETAVKAENAGATHIILPHSIAGRRITTQLLHPSITDFLDSVVRSHGVELGMEEVRVRPASELDGQTMADARIRSRTGVNIVAVLRPGRELPLISPPVEFGFRAGDTLVALGTPEQLQQVDALAGGDARRATR